MCHEGNIVYVGTTRGTSDKYHPVATCGDWVVCPHGNGCFVVHAPSGLAMTDPDKNDNTFISGYTVCYAYIKVLDAHGAKFPGIIPRDLLRVMNAAAREALAREDQQSAGG